MTGAEVLTRMLVDRGVRRLFGLPGSQNTVFYSRLRNSGIEPFVSNDEMSAGFAALGYAATSGTYAVMAIIDGPGLTYALTPLQEAKLDSIPIICLIFQRAPVPGKYYGTQAIGSAELSTPVAKAVLPLGEHSQIATVFDEAVNLAMGDEPGPVVILIDAKILDMSDVSLEIQDTPRPAATVSEEIVAKIRDEIDRKRTLLFLGRGALCCSREVRALAETTGSVVITSTSARGVLPEDHGLVLPCDLAPASLVNEFIRGFERVLALGIKFSENCARGYQLKIPEDRLIHVDPSNAVLGRNLPARVSVAASIPALVDALIETGVASTEVAAQELADWRARFDSERPCPDDGVFVDFDPSTPEGFYDLLRTALPRDSIVVTDSGKHQLVARRYFRSLSPHGLIVPTNFQAMGFGIPAAIGAKLANRKRPVVALVGDGGFLLSAPVLSRAAQFGISVTIVVIRDRFFGNIRDKQIYFDGRNSGVELPDFDIHGMSRALGARYARGSMDLDSILSGSLDHDGPTVIEIVVRDSMKARRQMLRSRSREFVRSLSRRS